MNFDKIDKQRLFSNNSEEEIKMWINGLQLFHLLKARQGHNCEGDKFAVHINYKNTEELTSRMNEIGIALNIIKQDAIVFDPFGDISLDKLDKIKYPIPEHPHLEQPQNCIIKNIPVHIWIQDFVIEIAISGANGNIYKISQEDYENCLKLEVELNKLAWGKHLNQQIKQQAHCISLDKYPELKYNTV